MGTPLYDTIMMDNAVTHLGKATECATPIVYMGVAHSVNNGLWLIMMCHVGPSTVTNVSWWEILITGKAMHVWEEKEMATHSNILPWGIPWTQEPVGLQFMGLQKSRT